MIVEQFANKQQTTLNGSINNSTTTVVVTSASGFPTKGNFRIIITDPTSGDEILLVTGVSGNTFTVSRGGESTAVSHGSGLLVTHVLTKESLQKVALNPIGSLNFAGQGLLLASHFEEKSSVAHILVSTDGISWSLLKPDPVYQPSGGVRDPSIYFDGTFYWMAYTRQGSPFYSWGLAKSNDLVNWIHVTDLNESGVGSTTLAWAPEWFIDPDDDSVHIIVALGASSTTMQLYETHPTATDFTTWSTPTVLTGTSLPACMIDGFILKVSGTYYTFYKNDVSGQKYTEVMTSTSLTSGYVVQGSGHWMSNWPTVSGNGWEGVCVVQIDANTWHMYIDNTDVSDNGLGYQYSIYTGSPGAGWLTGSNWAAPVNQSDPFVKRHGTVIRVQDFVSARNAFAAYLGRNRIPRAFVTGGTGVTNNTTTVFGFNNVVVDDGYFDGTNKFTAKTSGMYLLVGFVHWPSNGTGIRIIELRLNGTVYLNGQSDNAANTVSDVRHQMTALMWLNAGDYVQLTGFQTSGGTLTPTTQYFSIMRVGS